MALKEGGILMALQTVDTAYESLRCLTWKIILRKCSLDEFFEVLNQGSRRGPCPRCHRRRCNLNGVDGTFHCSGCGVAGGYTEFLALAQRVDRSLAHRVLIDVAGRIERGEHSQVLLNAGRLAFFSNSRRAALFDRTVLDFQRLGFGLTDALFSLARQWGTEPTG